MKRITTRVITTILAIVMLFGATMPTYAASCVTQATYYAECQTEDADKHVQEVFFGFLEHIRWLRFDTYIREILAKQKAQSSDKKELSNMEGPSVSVAPDKELPDEDVEAEPDEIPEENPELEIPSEEESVEKSWVYPEDVMDAFENELGYRPEYEEIKWYQGHWSLSVEFTHLDVCWDWEVKDSGYEGWRTTKKQFEETYAEICQMYLEPGVDIDSDIFFDTSDIEELFDEKYGYEIDVYVCTYHHPDSITADFVVCDRFNGVEYEIDAVQTTEGWMVPAANWRWFVNNFDFTDDIEYATGNIGWWDLDEILEEFKYMLGYVPKFEIWQDPELEWYNTLDFEFEHLGGKSYSIEWTFMNRQGEIMVSDKVFEEFLEENPEITKLLDIRDEEELERMYAFYKARLE